MRGTNKGLATDVHRFLGTTLTKNLARNARRHVANSSRAWSLWQHRQAPPTNPNHSAVAINPDRHGHEPTCADLLQVVQRGSVSWEGAERRPHDGHHLAAGDPDLLGPGGEGPRVEQVGPDCEGGQREEKVYAGTPRRARASAAGWSLSAPTSFASEQASTLPLTICHALWERWLEGKCGQQAPVGAMARG